MLPRLTDFRSIWDVATFLTGARIDARLRELRMRGATPSEAFDILYDDEPENDSWQAFSARSKYQIRKCDTLVSLLPERRYAKALDIGCGAGVLTERLAQRCDQVVGIDVSEAALRCARRRLEGFGNIRLLQGDVADLDMPNEGPFDLVVIADTLYYLDPPLTNSKILKIASSVSRLLAEDAIILLANHYFFFPNSDTKLTRRIHNVFGGSLLMETLSEHRRLFYLAAILRQRPHTKRLA
jgi:SAM-dependent methyltransferase